MKVSAKSEYGVRAMVHLARSYGQGPIPVSQVAEREHIPAALLEQLMMALRHAGLVTSVRGVRGGHILAKEPTDISVGDVMRAVDGPIVPAHCVEFALGEQATCGMGLLMLECTTRDVWVVLQEKISETLDGISLADLCQKSDALPGVQSIPMAGALLN